MLTKMQPDTESSTNFFFVCVCDVCDEFDQILSFFHRFFGFNSFWFLVNATDSFESQSISTMHTDSSSSEISSLPTTHSTATSRRRVSKTRDKFNKVKCEDERVTAMETLDKLTLLEERMDEDMYRTDLDMRSRSVRAYQKLCSRIQDLKVDKTLRDRIDRAVSRSKEMSANLCNSIKLLEKEEESKSKKKSILLHGSGST